MGDQGPVSLRNVPLSVMSAPRESQVKAFLRFNSEFAPPFSEELRGVTKASLYSLTRLVEGL